jgi:hypothetical protein
MTGRQGKRKQEPGHDGLLGPLGEDTLVFRGLESFPVCFD